VVPIDDARPEPTTSSVPGEVTDPDVEPTRSPTSPPAPNPATEPDDDRYEQL
jgi:hypothetical protein